MPSPLRGGVFQLIVYDSGDSVVIQEKPDLKQDNEYKLPAGTYRVVALFGGQSDEKTVTVEAGKPCRADFSLRDLTVNVTLSSAPARMRNVDGNTAFVSINGGTGHEVTPGTNETITVFREENYSVKVLYYSSEKATYLSSESPPIAEDEIKENEPVRIPDIDKGEPVAEPLLRIRVTSDDSDISGIPVNVSIDGQLYSLTVNEWTLITGLVAGDHTALVSDKHNGFTYEGEKSFTLSDGKTTDVDLVVTSDKSEGAFVIDDEIIGNVDISVEGLAAAYSSSSSMDVTAVWSGAPADAEPVWKLKPFVGEYMQIGTGASLSYPFEGTEEGIYVLAFDLMRVNEVAARQAWLIKVFE